MYNKEEERKHTIFGKKCYNLALFRLFVIVPTITVAHLPKENNHKNNQQIHISNNSYS